VDRNFKVSPAQIVCRRLNWLNDSFQFIERGKSGLHRKKYQVIPGRSNPRDSATENRPPNQGKGETVR
jgi:hypothetical protein